MTSKLPAAITHETCDENDGQPACANHRQRDRQSVTHHTALAFVPRVTVTLVISKMLSSKGETKIYTHAQTNLLH